MDRKAELVEKFLYDLDNINRDELSELELSMKNLADENNKLLMENKLLYDRIDDVSEQNLNLYKNKITKLTNELKLKTREIEILKIKNKDLSDTILIEQLGLDKDIDNYTELSDTEKLNMMSNIIDVCTKISLENKRLKVIENDYNILEDKYLKLVESQAYT